MGGRNKSKRKELKNALGPVRINYLLHVALYLSSQVPSNVSISSFYLRLLREVASKLTLRVDLATKLLICQRCSSFLDPGSTCTMRSVSKARKRSKNDTRYSRRCLFCEYTKKKTFKRN